MHLLIIKALSLKSFDSNAQLTLCLQQVNIDHITKDVTVRNLGRLTPMTFDLAQRQVFALMEKDSYRRFLKSNQYQEIIK